jgi:hypothetical protein
VVFIVDILNSDWLIKMLEKSSTNPHARLLKLFDILEDWLDAPNIVAPNRVTTDVVTSDIKVQINSTLPPQKNTHLLQNFLTLEAAKAGAAMPEILANQLYFMAVSAAQEKLQADNPKSLSHAKSAANALIMAQTKKEFHIKKSSAYAIAASFFAVVIGAGTLFMFNLDVKSKQLALSQPTSQTAMPTAVSALAAKPEQTAALVAQLELMRHGNCQLIEAIQLPDNQKAIYINMVVNGRVSTDPKEQLVALDLIKKTRCNYTPMLMANSRG